ncbi:MAG: prepilin peptidase [Candidatus Limnocylindrales bacterium]
MTTLGVAFAIVGLIVGYAADRLAARWPAHPDGTTRRRDWRTVVLPIGAAAAFGALPSRWSEPLDLAVLVVYFAALTVLAAVDLDQKLLPDVLTLPLALVAGGLVLVGHDPLLAAKDQPLLSAVLAGAGAPTILFALDRVAHGGLGAGDLKLAAGLGLISGVTRLFEGLLLASVGAGLVIVVLMAMRRLGLRTAIPFGPILVAGGILAALS